MVNHNSIKASSNEGEQHSGWEKVEAEAGKMDFFDIQVAQEAAAAHRDFDKKKEDLSKLREEISRLAKPSGNYVDGGNLDVKSITHDTSKLEEKAGALRDEVYDARKQYEALSTEEGRQAEAERRRKEAEEYDKYFTQGLMAVGTGKLQEFDDRISEARDPSAKERLMAEREDYIKSVVLPAGRMVVEGVEEDADVQNEDSETNDEISEEKDAEEKIQKEELSDIQKALEFVEKISKQELFRSINREKVVLGKILKRVEKYDSNQGKPSMGEKKQHKKDLQELRRYGYNPNGENSKLFDTLAKISNHITPSSYDAEEEREIGKVRAENWKRIELVAKGESGKAFRKELKKKGFSKLPEKWNDEDFTTEEISKIAFVAKYLIQE